MLAECISSFLDKAEGVNRSKGERFESTEERMDEINGAGFGQLVKAVEETKPKRTRTRKEKAEE